MRKFKLTTALAGMGGTAGIVLGLVSLRLWVNFSFYILLVSAVLLAIGFWRLWMDRPKS